MDAVEAVVSAGFGPSTAPDKAVPAVALLVDRALWVMTRVDFSLAGLTRTLARKVEVLYPSLVSFGLIFWPGSRPLDFTGKTEIDAVVESWS